jgi:hypothetical protein
MCGTMPLLPNTPSWRGAQFKKKAQGQLYLYLLIEEVIVHIKMDFKKKVELDLTVSGKDLVAFVGYVLFVVL